MRPRRQVMFDEVLEHILRIDRVLRQVRAAAAAAACCVDCAWLCMAVRGCALLCAGKCAGCGGGRLA